MMSSNQNHEDLLTEALFSSLEKLLRLSGNGTMTDLCQGELKVLRYLAECGQGYVLPSELCQALAVSSARIAATLNTLEKKHYIVRASAPEDRRKVHVALTLGGRQYIAAKQQACYAYYQQVTQQLGADDCRELARLLTRLAAILEQTPWPAGP